MNWENQWALVKDAGRTGQVGWTIQVDPGSDLRATIETDLARYVAAVRHAHKPSSGSRPGTDKPGGDGRPGRWWEGGEVCADVRPVVGGEVCADVRPVVGGEVCADVRPVEGGEMCADSTPKL